MELKGCIYFTDQRVDGLEICVVRPGISTYIALDHALHGVEHYSHPFHYHLLVGG